MAHQKTNHAIIFSIVLLLLLACRRESKQETVARWEIVNPVTNAPYVGVGVKLVLRDYRGNSPKSEVIWEGKTNDNGIAEYKFNAYKSSKFGYIEVANIASLGTNGVDYSIIRRPSALGLDKDEVNDLRYEIVPYVNIVSHIKNINCQGENDIMKFRQKALLTGSGMWSQWTPEHALFVGCVNNLSDLVSVKSDLYVSEIEVTRQNGEIEYFLDTSFIKGEYAIDTVRVYY